MALLEAVRCPVSSTTWWRQKLVVKQYKPQVCNTSERQIEWQSVETQTRLKTGIPSPTRTSLHGPVPLTVAKRWLVWLCPVPFVANSSDLSGLTPVGLS